ncbi:hypothetical protein ETD86_52830 [Nonomuraea turkmeniaca]|uniref:Uncharacterized protein n=1 Tax=Nonomuraea turkmeniaca TaxID=103838 RepID=A0A5S4EUY6_9ACTN|nr:hypothetical protein [Nonomuraea turkmeniaca]TMR06378.1 hypothetical protein ETD86_52830 [Nonomuraea turkmeniaca]
MAATTSRRRSPSTLANKTKQAHGKVMQVRARHTDATHPRDLAALVLVLVHKNKAEAVMRRANLTRSMWHNEIKPHAPLELPDWTEDEALAIIDAQLQQIAKIDSDLEKAMDERARHVAALAQHYTAEFGRSRGVKAAIVAATGLNMPLVGRDLERAAKIVTETKPAADAGEQAHAGEQPDADDTFGREMLPAPEVAARLGTTLNKFLARIKYADASVGPGPISRRGRGRVMLYDVETTRRWWQKNRFDWLSVTELAERWGAEARVVRERLRGAATRGVTPEHLVENGRYRYNPGAADAWWNGLQKLGQAVAEGEDDKGRWTTARLARELGTTPDKVKDVTRAWREKGELTAHVTDERGHRWWNPEPFLEKWRAEGRPVATKPEAKRQGEDAPDAGRS